jgi:mono/diheme cytochrome c family protein
MHGCAFLAAELLATCAVQAQTADQVEFFESRIRAVLATHCFKCHVGEKRESGLQLDSREGLLAGGDRGPALVPGDVENSRLIQAVRHLPDAELQMPPDEKLRDDQIADLEAWVAMGAPWPKVAVPPHVQITEQQRQHWAFRPMADPSPPAVRDTAWPRQDLDYFILARLEAAELSPAEPADRATLIRRATFDLLGLPPTPEEVKAFVADSSPDAWPKVVDHLLAHPGYGERWARHWLDLVRYAETDGHEFDTDKPNAYRYRDYVIEAFHADLPFDQFIREQIAGDLLPRQRISGDGGARQSALGTAFFYLGEVQNNPVEPERDLANQVENQLDVLGKTFLGLTLGCARCHDHKFDPISMNDYYALAGFLYSSEKSQECVDTEERAAQIEARRRQLAERRTAIEQIVAPARRRARADAAHTIGDYLLGARDVLRAKPEYRVAEIELASLRRQLDAAVLKSWVDYLAPMAFADDNGNLHQDGVFDLWAALSRVADSDFPIQVPKLLAERKASRVEPPESEVFADFDSGELNGWKRVGAAFGVVAPSQGGLSGLEGAGAASSNRGTAALVGRLISPTFTIRRSHVWFSLAGDKDPRKLRLSLCINGQPIPLYTATGEGNSHLRRGFFDVHTLIGKEAFLEVVDESTQGAITVDDVRFADGPPGVAAELNASIEAAVGGAAPDPPSLAAALQQTMLRALSQSNDHHRQADAALAAWALRGDVPLASDEAHPGAGSDADLPLAVRRHLTADELAQARQLAEQCRQLEVDFPTSVIALVARDRQAVDAWLHVRGEYTNRGAQIPRGYLSAIGPQDPPPDRRASGRLQLAEWIASAANPLTARVIVNRVWQHHFGQGLVTSADNFGLTGQPPSHPELLDFLASRFVRSGWSLKALHRTILLSATYQQSSEVSQRAKQIDADNRLLSHWSPRRLEAECIRDAILAVSGSLDPRMYGPSVPVYFSERPDARDAPPVMGPPDGDCRRSIYLEVRRNYLSPFLSVFDLPRPSGTVGRRDRSAVPAQALTLLNDQFVQDQARAWASRLIDQYPVDSQRVERMYWEAFSRPPDAVERDRALRFVRRQAADYAKLAHHAARRDAFAWGDLAHVLFNLGEFSFVR